MTLDLKFYPQISMMLQSADDIKLYSKTDNSNSHYVEEELSDALQRAMMALSLSAVSYEDTVQPGVRTAVVVHELYCDPGSAKRKKKDQAKVHNKDELYWDDNYTDTAYVFTSKGLPNSWNNLDSLAGNEFIITKLLPSKYSVCYSTNMHNFGLSTLRWKLQEMHIRGFEEIISLASVGGDSRKVICSVVSHITLLSNIISLQLQEIKSQQVQLLLDHSSHIHTLTSYLLGKYDTWCRAYLQAWNIQSLLRYMSDLYQLKTCLSTTIFLPLSKEQKEELPHYLSKEFDAKLALLDTAQDDLNVLMEQIETLLKNKMTSRITEKFELPHSSYWKKDIIDWDTPAPYIQHIIELVLTPVYCALEGVPLPLKSKIYQLLYSAIAQLVRYIMRSDKKIAISLCGLLHLQKALNDLCDYVTSGTCSVAPQQLLINSDVTQLRQELASLLNRRAKASSKQTIYKCSCADDRENWKRLSAPQLCSECKTGDENSTTSDPGPRDIFSDSEVDGSLALTRTASDWAQQKKQLSWRKKLAKMKKS